MKKCENCELENNVIYGSGRFCSSKCARGFSTKNNRIEINYKISLSTKGKKLSQESREKLSKNNGSHKKVTKDKISIGVKKSFTKEKKKILSEKLKGRKLKEETKKIISAKNKEKCKNIEERNRLREIGRKGGFGKKGYIHGIYYQSNLEKQCFEFLIKNEIKFTPHKSLPDSSKVCDVYLKEKNIWIELDGINREKRRKWLGKDYDYWIKKLEEYNQRKLNFNVLYSFEEFKKYMEEIYKKD